MLEVWSSLKKDITPLIKGSSSFQTSQSTKITHLRAMLFDLKHVARIPALSTHHYFWTKKAEGSTQLSEEDKWVNKIDGGNSIDLPRWVDIAPWIVSRSPLNNKRKLCDRVQTSDSLYSDLKSTSQTSTALISSQRLCCNRMRVRQLCSQKARKKRELMICKTMWQLLTRQKTLKEA